MMLRKFSLSFITDMVLSSTTVPFAAHGLVPAAGDG
jgi:hypothetical protein